MPCTRLYPLWVIFLGTLTGCFQAPIRSDGDSTDNKRSRLILASAQTEGREVASYDPNASTAQRIEANNTASLGGAAVVLSPGSLAVPTNIVIEEGQSLKDTSIMSELGLQNDVKVTNSATSVIVRPEENASLQKPMSLEIPMPGLGLWAKLMDDDPYANVVILYRALKDDGVVSGLMPRSSFQVVDNKAKFSTLEFGSFQAVMLDKKIEEKKEAKSDEPIRNVSNVPVVTDQGVVTPEVITKKEETPPATWAAVIASFDVKSRSVHLNTQQTSSYIFTNCRAMLRENIDIPSSLEVLTDSKLDADFAITKETAHSLFGRFECIDNLERTAYSPWSAIIAVPEAPKAPPAISAVDIAAAAKDGINIAESSFNDALVTVSATDYTSLSYVIVASSSASTIDCSQHTNFSTTAPTFASINVDGSYIVCVKATNSQDTSVFASSLAITRDTIAPTLTSFNLINDAADGFISSSEINSTKPIFELIAAGFDKAEFTGFLGGSAICDKSQIYNNVSAPMVNSLPTTDGAYSVCVKLSDLSGNMTYGSSKILTRQAQKPVFNSLGLATVLSDGYLNATESSAGTNLLGSLVASGYTTVDYLIAQNTAICDNLVYGAGIVTANSSSFTGDGSFKICVRLLDSLGNSTFGASASFTRDTTAPTPVSRVLTQSSTAGSSILTWSAASDNLTSAANLVYCAYQSSSATFDTLSQVQAGTAIGACSNQSTATASNLATATTYYFNVIVKDQAGNAAVYQKGNNVWVSLTSPAAGSFITASNASSLNFSGACFPDTANGIGISGAALTSTSCTGGIWSATLNVTSQPDGSLSFIIGMNDGLSSSALTQTFNFTKDTVAPTAGMTNTPAANMNLSSINVVVGGTDVVQYKYALVSSYTCSTATYSASYPITTNITNTLTTDGTYYLCVLGIDAAGNVQSATSSTFISWTRDTIAPAAPVISLANGAIDGYINSSEYLQPQAVANVTGAGTLAYTILMSDISPAITCDASKTYNATMIPLASDLTIDGTFAFCVEVKDAAGNAAYGKSPQIVRDIVGPVVYAGPDLNSNIAMTISGATASADATTKSWSVFSGNAGSISFTNATLLNPSVNAIADGAYTLRLTATDVAGNSSFDDMILNWDSTPPVFSSVSLLNAAADGYINIAESSQTTPILNVAATGYSTLNFSLPQTSGGMCTSSLTYGNTVIPSPSQIAVADGSYVICVKATDNAGNSSYAASPLFTVDTSAPTVNAGADISTNTVPTISASATGSITLYQWSVVSGPGSINFSNPTGAVTMATPSMDGAYVLRLTVTEASGNSAFDDVILTWDTTPPTVTLFAGANEAGDTFVNNNEKNSALPAFTLTAAGYATILYTNILSDNTPVICDASQTYTNSAVPAISSMTVDGKYSICAKLVDSVGNIAYNKAGSIIRDTVAPSVNFLSGFPAALSNLKFITLTIGDQNTPAENIGSYRYAINSVPMGSTPLNDCDPNTLSAWNFVSPAAMTAQLTNLDVGTDGLKIICVEGKDEAGNTLGYTFRYNWTFDQTPPVASLSGTPPQFTNSTSLMFFINGGSDPAAGLYDQYQYAVVKAGDCTTASGSYGAWTNYTNTPQIQVIQPLSMGDGIYTICVNLKDIAGNIQTTATAYTFTLDTIAPVPGNTGTITTSSDNIGSTVAVGWTAATDAIGLDHYEIYMDTANSMIDLASTISKSLVSANVPTTNLTYSASGLTSNTVRYFNVIAVDRAGNKAPYVQNTSGYISVTTPATNQTVGFESSFAVTFSGTCSSPATSIAVSGPINGTTSCSGSTWTYTGDLSNLTNGSQNIVFTMGQGSSSQAVANGTVSIQRDVITGAPAKLTSSQTQSYRTYPNLHFGSTVAISDDELKMAIAAPNDPLDNGNINPVEEAGAIYFYSRATIGGTWTMSQKLVAPGANSRKPKAHFGQVMAMSGNNLVVGIPNYDLDAMGAAPMDNAGIAYVYSYSGATWNLTSTLTVPASPGRHIKDFFGASVAIFNDRILIGASGYDYDAAGGSLLNDAGAAFLYRFNGTDWLFEKMFIPEIVADRVAGDGFGTAVAVNGSNIMIGSPYFDRDINNIAKTDVGAVFAWNWDGTNWVSKGRVPVPSADQYASDYFGSFLALSTTNLAVGAPNHDYDTAAVPVTDAGAVYTFHWVAPNWNYQQKIVAPQSTYRRISDFFGAAVKFATDSRLFIGAENYQFNSAGTLQLAGAGALFVYDFNGSNWTYDYLFISPSRYANDGFGSSVGVTNTSVVIGSPDHDYDQTNTMFVVDSGAAFAGTCDNMGCTAVQKYVVNPVNKMLVSPLSRFGSDIALSDDELTMIVGAPDDSTDMGGTNFMEKAGAAYVYFRPNVQSAWTFQQKLVPNPTMNSRAAWDHFGQSVDVSGDVAVIGAPNHCYDSAGSTCTIDAGAAFVFKRTGSTWSQYGNIILPNQTNSRSASDYFGTSVAVSTLPTITIAVGANGQDYDSTGTMPVTNAGAVYVYIDSGSSMTYQAKVTASTNARYADDNFGISLDLEGDRLLVGASGHSYDESGVNLQTSAGSAFIFNRSGTIWNFSNKLTASMAGSPVNSRNAYDYFGYAVALSGNSVIVGAPGHSYDMGGTAALMQAGAAFTYAFNGTTWNFEAKLVSDVRNNGDFFGKFVALRAHTAGVSAPGQDFDALNTNPMRDAGAGYVFYRSNTNVWTLHKKITPDNLNRAYDDKFGYGIAIGKSGAFFAAHEHDYDTAHTEFTPNTGAVFSFNRAP